MSTITVGEKEFELTKSGRDQAEQVINISRWLSQYGLPALQNLSDEEGNIVIENGFQMLSEILNELTVDALIELFALTIGCTNNFANKHFDVSVLIDALSLMYETQPAFQKVISRFFSPTISTSDTEE